MKAGLAIAETKKSHSARNKSSVCHFSNWRLGWWEMKVSDSSFKRGSKKEKHNMTSHTLTHISADLFYAPPK